MQITKKSLNSGLWFSFKHERLFVIIILLLSLIFSDSLYAKRKKKKKRSDIKVRIDQPYSQHFPSMTAYVSVTQRNNEPVMSLVRGNFSVFIDGQKITSKIDVAGFQYTEEGISYALVIAGNGLMEGTPIEIEKQAAVNLSEYLREQDQLSVYVYADEVQPVFEFQKKDESLVQKINKIDVLGSNPRLNDVIIHAARRLKESQLTRKVVIIMSDGRDIGSRFTQKQVNEILDEINIPVYSIGIKLMSGQNLYKLAKISNHTGGEYIFARTMERIPDALTSIYNQITLGYVLKFDVDFIDPDNKLHQMQVKVNHKGNEGSFFKNFVAVKTPLSIVVMIVIGVIVLILLIVAVILIIFRLKRVRKEMGITKRICPECNRRMKDDWDECYFCKYQPEKKKGFFKNLLAKFKK
jgi:VWFA-related protein